MRIIKKLIVIIVLSITTLLLNFSCDGIVEFKGAILENFSNSMIVSDSTYSLFSFNTPIKNAIVNFYILDDRDSVLGNMFSNTFFSDSNGYFKAIGMTGLGKEKALLVVSKKDFKTDSLFFEFESSSEPIYFIISLKKQN
jgi:hypothetical protein